MPELRWTLLIIGVLFIAVLAWWERRRPHQASRQAPHIGGEPRPVVNNEPTWGSDVEPSVARPAAPHISREPTLTLPEIRTEARGEGRAGGEGRMEFRAREPIAPRELPVVEIPDSVIGPDDEIAEEDISEELEELSQEMSKDASKEAAAKLSRAVKEEAEELDDELEVDESDELDEAEGREAGEEKVVAGEVELEGGESVGPVVIKTAPELPPPVLNTVKPIVEWPPDEQRKVVALRLVARPPDRFRGTLVRQAMAAEGFILGEFDIFHKPDAQNRAVLSAASLTKPGTFDLDTMDTQRYVGLNLFAVLPGPKPPRKAFEDLLMSARMLNERLEGALQDERGGPLTPMRIQAIRDTLETEAKS